jgi:hypothetical protein
VADPSETTQITRHDPPEAPASDVLEAVRSLSTQVRDLQEEIRVIRAQTRQLPSAGVEAPGWEDGGRRSRDSYEWVRSLEGPSRRQPPVPRLLLELVFLAGVAVACAIAKLDSDVIVAVMAGAWVLVALAEWTAARADRRRTETVYVPLHVAGEAFAEDPSWFAPPVERTSLDVAGEAEDTAAGLEQPS